MAATLNWSQRAMRDLDGIYNYIANDSPRYALLTVERIRQAIQSVCRFPQSGRQVPGIDDDTLRQVFWRHYRIVYRIEGDRLFVVTVVHGARLFDPTEDEDIA